MTATELKDYITTQLAIPLNLVSKLKAALFAMVDFTTSSVSSIIPYWTNALTFNTSGSGSGVYCTYADTDGKNRLWQTLTDGNINNPPPTNPATTSNAFWQEVSASASAAIPEWAAGVYGPGLIIVFHNHSIDGRGLYVLLDPVRPYASANIETEIAASDWELISGGTALTITSWNFAANSNNFPVVGAGINRLYVSADQHGTFGDADFVDANTWMVSKNPAGSSTYADFYYK